MDLLESKRLIRSASIGRYPFREQASTLARWACEQVSQQRTYAAPDVARATSRFPHASHVQHSIYFWNIQVQQLQHRKEDRWNT
jgi:hypothetical protein